MNRLRTARAGFRASLVVTAVATCLLTGAVWAVADDGGEHGEDPVTPTGEAVTLESSSAPSSGRRYELRAQQSTGGLCFELVFLDDNSGSGGCGLPVPDVDAVGVGYQVDWNRNETLVYGPAAIGVSRVYVWLRDDTQPKVATVVEIPLDIRRRVGIEVPLNYYVVGVKRAALVERIAGRDLLGNTVFDRSFDSTEPPAEAVEDTEP
jgi:hypothetical protein